MDELGNLDRKICPQHQKSLELFCRTDQMCICAICTVSEHKGHDIVSAEAERSEKQVRRTPHYTLFQLWDTKTQTVWVRCLNHLILID